MGEILVTGACGFIGAALCEKLSFMGHRVCGTATSAEKLSGVSKWVRPLVIEQIGPATDWSDALINIDTIIHLASRVHIMRETATDSLSAYRCVNVEGTERLARKAAEAGVRRFVYISSIKVNGEGSSLPYKEVDTPAPFDPYAVSKWEAEQLLHKISSESALEVVILRPPLVYGPRVRANFLSLLKLVSSGFPLPFFNLNNKRSLIYLGNLVDAIIACLTHPNAVGETFLISDGYDVSTPQLVRMMATASGIKSRLFPFPISLLNIICSAIGKRNSVDRIVGSLRIDSSKIRKTVGWQPPFSLEEGLEETVKWFKSI